jgi:outer membrane protein assembly factor BamA
MAKITLPVRILLFFVAISALDRCSHFDGHAGPMSPDLAESILSLERKTPDELMRASAATNLIKVGKIQIMNLAVLDNSYVLAPLVNALHFVTQPDVIFDELQLEPDRDYPAWKLYDAERYVRALDPIKQVHIVQKNNPDTGRTDLWVVTQDKITAQVNGSATGSGGYSSLGLVATESSLFGRLVALTADYSRENFRDHVGLSVGKSRIGGSRWQVSTKSGVGFSDGIYNLFAQEFKVEHPFLRNGQQHSFRAAANITNGVNYDFLGSGIRKGEDLQTGKSFDLIYRTHLERFDLQYLYGIGVNNRVEFGPGFSRIVRKDYYIASPDQYQISESPEVMVSDSTNTYYKPRQYSTHAISFTVNTRNGKFGPMRNFRRYLFVEDQFEGFRTTSSVAHADPKFGLKDYYTAPSFTMHFEKNFLHSALRTEISGNRAATFWHEGYIRPVDDTVSGEFKFFWFNSWGTLALRQVGILGYHLTAEKRNEIGSMFARGFYYGSVFPSAGSLFSLEYRSPAVKIPYVLLAGAVFTDYAGVGNRPGALDWVTIVGVGLRAMLYEFDNNVFRLDIGINLQDKNLNLLNSLQFGLNQSF